MMIVSNSQFNIRFSKRNSVVLVGYYAKIYFQTTGKITTNVMAYDILDFLGDIGGYTGIIIGISFFDLANFLEKRISNKFNKE